MLILSLLKPAIPLIMHLQSDDKGLRPAVYDVMRSWWSSGRQK